MKRKDSSALIALSSAAILLLLFLWRKKVTASSVFVEQVTSHITFDGQEVFRETNNVNLTDLYKKMYPGEYLDGSKLCYNSWPSGKICGDAVSILMQR
jgi:hypothetical protein